MTENIIFTKEEIVILEKTVGELLLKYITDGWEFNRLGQWARELREALVTSNYRSLAEKININNDEVFQEIQTIIFDCIRINKLIDREIKHQMLNSIGFQNIHIQK